MTRKVLWKYGMMGMIILGMMGCSAKEKTDPKQVAELIDSIYVQKRTEETDAQCEAAKKAWDMLTEEQKSQVEGKFADPDYFGRDTGDASLDNSRNQNEIGEKEILVVSFGTSFNDSRVMDIKGIEDAIEQKHPDWSVRRAFTSQIIINHIQARDGEKIDNMEQALERAVENGVKQLVVVPTHLMKGYEYDELTSAVEEYAGKFETVSIAAPLLGKEAAGSPESDELKTIVATAAADDAMKEAGFSSMEEAKESKTAFVFLGHGTSHAAKVCYERMQELFDEMGYDNAFVGTVEGEPEGTSCEDIIEKMKNAGYKRVVLRPLMVVAGDHANNDMAGEEDSWKSEMEKSGDFEQIDAVIKGLGCLSDIWNIYLKNTDEAISNLQGTENTADTGASEGLKDGEYLADFKTDSGMFSANETCDGKGTLTVKDGKMMFHVSLTSENIVNLYCGLAEDAEKEGAVLLMPTKDTVTYEDGSEETVNGFDIPVSAIGKEFDLALIGKKGVWYDHKVSIENPEEIQ